MLLAHELVDLVVEVADLEIAEAEVLDLGHLARDLLEHLAAPFLARRDRLDAGDGFGPPRARDVEDAERGGLLRPEAEEHRLRFFRIAGLGRWKKERRGLVVFHDVGGGERGWGRKRGGD